MIRIIKSNSPLNYALMFVLMLILWGFKFYYMPTPIETYEVSNWLIPKLPETIFLKYLSAAVSFVFLYFFAVIINRFNSRLVIVENGYQAPGILFVLLSGVFINAQRILPETLASFSLFFAMMRVFYSYKNTKAYSNMLDAGIFTSLSILLFHKLVFFIPLILIVIFIIRPIKLREIIIFFTGLILSFAVGVAIIWFWGNPTLFLSSLESAIGTKYSYVKYTSLSFIIFGPVVFLAIVSLLGRFIINVPRKISTRKFQTSLILILATLTAFFASPHATNESIVLLFPFLSLMLSNIIINAKKIYVYLVFWGLAISILISQSVQILHYLTLY